MPLGTSPGKNLNSLAKSMFGRFFTSKLARSGQLSALEGNFMRDATDVLVIGDGSAGLAAAIAARKKGFSVTVADGATKLLPCFWLSDCAFGVAAYCREDSLRGDGSGSSKMNHNVPANTRLARRKRSLASRLATGRAEGFNKGRGTHEKPLDVWSSCCGLPCFVRASASEIRLRLQGDRGRNASHRSNRKKI